MKPRILLLSTAYLPLIGGSELAIHHIAQQLTDYEFDMVTGRYHADAPLVEDVGRVRVFRAGGRWAHWSFMLPKVLMPVAVAITAFRLLRTRTYVAVHAYQASQAGAAGAILSLLFPRTPFILTLQEGKDLAQQSLLTRITRRWIVRRATRVTVISQYLADIARQLGAQRVELIPNGVDTEAFQPHDTQLGARILTVSRLVPKNNIAALIRALPLVRAQIPAATLTVIGSGPLQSSLEDLASDLHVRSAVEFTGAVPHNQLPVRVASADVFARVSLSEGFGSVFLEAMACKVPVVASPIGGIPDIVKQRETGLLVDPHDDTGIADAIVTLLQDTALRGRCIDNAFRMVCERYDWRAIAHQMDAVYHELTPNL